MTSNQLERLTLKDLAQMAKKRGVDGWHSMRKHQLVAALAGAKSRAPQRKSATKVAPRRTVAKGSSRTRSTASSLTRDGRNGHAGPARHANGKRVDAPQIAVAAPKSPAVTRKIERARAEAERTKNLAHCHASDGPGGSGKERLVVMVRDPYWLHAYWELSRAAVTRAEAAMGQDWHTARPVLRLLDVSSNGTTSSAEKVVRHVPIHGGVNNWYIDVTTPQRSYRVEIGYLASSGRFFLLARSNVVTTPAPGASDSIDRNWSAVAENFEKIYAQSGGYAPEGPSLELQELFEERLRRPMGSPVIRQFGAGAQALLPHRQREFNFELDAELIVFGQTEPESRVTLQGEPVALRPDGSFTVRFAMPNCRQVIPAVAHSADGVEQRTIVLAVERNTKVMEPVTRDTAE